MMNVFGDRVSKDYIFVVEFAFPIKLAVLHMDRIDDRLNYEWIHVPNAIELLSLVHYGSYIV